MLGLSGAGPGNFTWTPDPKDLTLNPRLLKLNKRNEKNIPIFTLDTTSPAKIVGGYYTAT